ncbi:MAG: hypothetical protein JW801_04000 [Bacteroidales bacterium]|nr:hypothetical protein [Bacteroidales bacterium]
MKKLIILGVLGGLIIYSCNSNNSGDKKPFTQGIQNYDAEIAGSTSFANTGAPELELKAEPSATPVEGPAEEAETRGVVHLTKESFLKEVVDYESNPNEWIYKGQLPAMIDFYADWCRPCKITSPIIEELAKEYAGKIQFFKIDVQTEQELAAAFGIQSIPSFLFIPMEEMPVMSMGIAQTPEETKAMFQKQIEDILMK